MNTLAVSVISTGILGAAFGLGLAYASRKFAVKTDPRIEQLVEALPGANCGGCGFAGCQQFAESLAKGESPVTGCPVSSSEQQKALAAILGVDLSTTGARLIAQVKCHGGSKEALTRAEYVGVQTCKAAQAVGGGFKACEYGCLGLGDCAAACPFDAIHIGKNGLPVVDPEACTGCGNCVKACPRSIIDLADELKPVHVRCKSLAKGKEVREACQVGCIACRACERVCPVGAITVNNNVASIDYDKCTACGLCVEKCPMNTIEFEDRLRQQLNQAAG